MLYYVRKMLAEGCVGLQCSHRPAHDPVRSHHGSRLTGAAAGARGVGGGGQRAEPAGKAIAARCGRRRGDGEAARQSYP